MEHINALEDREAREQREREREVDNALFNLLAAHADIERLRLLKEAENEDN